jgi:hypothetical protein
MYIVPPRVRYVPPITKPGAQGANLATEQLARIIGDQSGLSLLLYPVLTLLLPIAVVAVFSWQTSALLVDSVLNVAAGTAPAAQGAELTLSNAMRLGFLGVPFTTLAAIFADAVSPPQTAATFALDTAGRLTFIGVHLIALATSLVALLAGLEVARRFAFAKSARGAGGIVAMIWHVFGVALAAALVRSGCLATLFGAIWDPSRIVAAFKQLIAVLALPEAHDVTAILTTRLTLFAQSAGAAAIVLIVTAAMISYRWPMLGVAWYQPADLARQRRWLIGLFVLASVLLVFGAATLRAAEDWPGGLIGPDAKLGAVKATEAWARLASAVSTYWGVFASLALVAAFGPAFVSLARDIDLAAKIGLAAETTQAPAKRGGHFVILPRRRSGLNRVISADLTLSDDPAPVAPVAAGATPEEQAAQLLSSVTYAQLLKWKQDHGLDLSTSQIATALVAVAAPLLASPAIDLSKIVAL